jgi:hypothetical protein
MKNQEFNAIDSLNNNYILVGKRQYLLDITKIFNDAIFVIDPCIEALEEIYCGNLYNKITLVFISEENKINRNNIDKFANQNVILFLESGQLSLKYKYLKIDHQITTAIIAKFLKISNVPVIQENIFDNLFQYQILGRLPNQFNKLESLDPIRFFRSKLNELSRSNYSENKLYFFKSILYRLEYSFKITGLRGLPIYFMILEKIIY